MAQVIGVRKWNQKLSRLRKGINTVIRPGMSEACKTATKKVKAEIRPMYKDVRKSIGWTVRSKQGNLTGKVGAAVGFRGSRKAKFLAKQQVKRKGNPGIGFSPQNIHWWFLGSQKRFGKKDGRFRGRMPRMNRSVSMIVLGSSGAVFGSMVVGCRKGFGKLMR